MTLSLTNPLDDPASVTLTLARKPESNITDDTKQGLSESEEKGALEDQGKEGMKKSTRGSDSLSEKGLPKTPKIPVDNSCDNGALDDTAEVGIIGINLKMVSTARTGTGT